MFKTSTQGTLSRRGSKLLVELIIGVIGVLGIMLAQNSQYGQAQLERLANKGDTVAQSQVSNITQKVDWLDIIF